MIINGILPDIKYAIAETTLDGILKFSKIRITLIAVRIFEISEMIIDVICRYFEI